MSLDDAFDKLNAAFNEVAREIEQLYPTAWKLTAELLGEDTVSRVMYMQGDAARFGDPSKSVLEIAKEKGEDFVVKGLKDNINVLEYGK